MTREIKSKAELLDMLRNEAAKYQACDGNYIGPILDEEDESGCNWKLSIYLKNKNRECVECMEPFIHSLRQKYNIPQSHLLTQQQIAELSEEDRKARFERGWRRLKEQLSKSPSFDHYKTDDDWKALAASRMVITLSD